jgi:hypothetical protein
MPLEKKLLHCLLVIGIALPAWSQVGPSSGKALCSALTAADFTKAGVPVSALSQANLDGTDSAYCVYASKAPKNNVEFDIFFPAGGNAVDVQATEKTVLGEVGAKAEPVKIAGADNAQFVLNPSDPTGSIVVRKGKAVFGINIPKGPDVRKQLVALAEIVLARLKQ